MIPRLLQIGPDLRETLWNHALQAHLGPIFRIFQLLGTVKKSALTRALLHCLQVRYSFFLDGFVEGVEADVRDALTLTGFISFEA